MEVQGDGTSEQLSRCQKKSGWKSSLSKLFILSSTKEMTENGEKKGEQHPPVRKL
jgi:hypothetical protein